MSLKRLEDRLVQQILTNQSEAKERLEKLSTDLNSRVDDLETSVTMRLKTVDDRLRGCEETAAASTTSNANYVKQLHEANKKTATAVKNLQVKHMRIAQ